MQGQVYALECSASGGSTPYQWSGGGLPTGVSIDSSTGLISGKPTVLGPFSATITVTTALANNRTPRSAESSVQGQSAQPAESRPPWYKNQPFNPGVRSHGRGRRRTTGAPLACPNGVAIDPNSGLISGKPARGWTLLRRDHRHR